VSTDRYGSSYPLIPIVASGAVRRPVGRRNALALAKHSSRVDITDDEDEPMSENDGDVESGDDEEDDEVSVNAVGYGTLHTLF